MLDWWVFRGTVVEVERIEPANVRDEFILLIKQFVLRRGREAEKLRREVETLETFDGSQVEVRELIPENVRLFVWQRDKGQCVKCGSRERLEFDLCLANRYAGRFYLLYESELSLTFGTHLVARDRIGESALRLGTSERFLGVPPRSTEYRSKGESLISQAAAGVW